MSNHQFPGEWHLINQESLLIHNCIANGLTDLANANIDDTKGKFYSAFFNLSISMERILKLIIIIDAMLHGKQLTSKELRNYGHGITELLNHCQSMASNLNLPCNLTFQDAKVKRKLIDFLDDYAKTLRYHNIDSLAGGKSKADPLSEWNNVIKLALRDLISEKKLLALQEQSRIISDMLPLYAIHHDLEQNLLSPQDILLQPFLVNKGCRSLVLHTIEIFDEINILQFHISDTAQWTLRDQYGNPKVPFIREYYHFLLGGRKRHRKKNRWP